MSLSVASQAENASWFAVQTRPRHEKTVSLGLREKGLHSYLPVQQETRQWSDRRKSIELPLFSQYVFVQIAENAELRARVLRTRGVVRFAGAPNHGTSIPEEQIRNLQAITERQISCRAYAFLKVGEKVRIRGGALNGLEGILVAIKNEKSLIVSVDLIQKSVAIRLDGFEVERI